MFKWPSIVSLLTTLSLVGAGCACPQMGYYSYSSGPGAVCNPRYCAETCGPTWGASYQACGPTECDPCDPCGPCYYGEYSPLGPFAAIFRLFRPVSWVGPSCGERYWGDFYGEPPDCCDPCDRYGNYTGMQVPAACHAGACIDSGCEPGFAAGPRSGGPGHAAPPRYATGHRPVMPVRQEPAYLGQSRQRAHLPAMPVRRQSAHVAQHPTQLRSPAGATSPGPQLSSQYAPRIISVDDRIVGEPGPQPTTAARRIEAVQR